MIESTAYIEVHGEDHPTTLHWGIEECACTSEAGNQQVTEQWQEASLMFAECGASRYDLDNAPGNPWEKAVQEAYFNGKLEL